MMALHVGSELLGVLLLGVAAAYSLTAFVASLVWQLRGLRREGSTLQPPVSVLKPLCGAEPELYENLRSFCMQQYRQYQLVFGVRDRSDGALEIVSRLRREFPSLAIELAVEESQQGPNRKVSNLINMLPRARHDILVIADSDTRMRPDYLRTVVAPLIDPQVGLVTCLYRCIPVGGIWSRLGAMYINDWYMPSVMLAWLFGHREYVSGQTIALRRETLRAAGGLPALVNHLADDYQLGDAVRRLGLRTVLSHYAAETVQGEATLESLMGHELRWMRTLRALAPAGFRFLFVSFTLPLAALGYALAQTQPRLPVAALVCVAIVSRLGSSCVPRLLQGRIPFSDLLLLPPRDLLLCWVWSRALFASRLRWRGHEFDIDRHGVMRSSP